MRDYKKIKAFQHADHLAVAVYEATQQFPKEELYGITSQIRRAAVSIPTNIAEGASRQHEKDYIHFLYIARASGAELKYLLGLAARLHYLNQADYVKLDFAAEETSKTLYGLINSMRRV